MKEFTQNFSFTILSLTSSSSSNIVSGLELKANSATLYKDAVF
jgi:hypothetical protein